MTESRKIDKIFIDMFDHGVHKETRMRMKLWCERLKGRDLWGTQV